MIEASKHHKKSEGNLSSSLFKRQQSFFAESQKPLASNTAAF